MMKVLEEHRNSQIVYTVKQVSRHFTEVFGKLVPNGRGKMAVVGGTEEDIDQASGLVIEVMTVLWAKSWARSVFLNLFNNKK